MTRQELSLIAHFLSRVTVRGYQEETELLDLINKVYKQIDSSNTSTTTYSKVGDKVA